MLVYRHRIHVTTVDCFSFLRVSIKFKSQFFHVASMVGPFRIMIMIVTFRLLTFSHWDFFLALWFVSNVCSLNVQKIVGTSTLNKRNLSANAILKVNPMYEYI